MILIERPMLAPLNSPADTPTFFEDIQYPQLVSPKIDGIRAVIGSAVKQDFTSLDLCSSGELEISVLSRNMDKFRSRQAQSLFGVPELLHMDGEMAYNPIAPDCLHVTQGHLSAFDKPCETLKYYVFDWCDPNTLDEPYYIRHERLVAAADKANHSRVEVIPQINVESLDELLAIEARYLEEGYEGVMFRNPVGHYKQNRATYRENLIYKLKRFKDGEAIIVGFGEGEKNTNAQERDTRGFAKRSSSKEGKIPNGMVGKILCRRLKDDHEFFITPGVMTHAQRKYIWEHQDEFIGKIVTYRYFDYGIKDEVRFARFIAFREKWDM